MALYLTLCDMGLTDLNYVSYNNFQSPWDIHRGKPDTVIQDTEVAHHQLFEKYNFKHHWNNTEFPVKIDIKHRLNYNFGGDLVDAHNDFWQDFAYDFDVITETSVTDLFYTEKTARALLMGKPFMLLGAQNTMHNLIDRYGLHSVEDYVNLEYDTQENLSDRVEALCVEIQRICNLDKDNYLKTIQGISNIATLNAQIIHKKFG